MKPPVSPSAPSPEGDATHGLAKPVPLVARVWGVPVLIAELADYDTNPQSGVIRFFDWKY